MIWTPGWPWLPCGMGPRVVESLPHQLCHVIPALMEQLTLAAPWQEAQAFWSPKLSTVLPTPWLCRALSTWFPQSHQPDPAWALVCPPWWSLPSHGSWANPPPWPPGSMKVAHWWLTLNSKSLLSPGLCEVWGLSLLRGEAAALRGPWSASPAASTFSSGALHHQPLPEPS